MVDFLDNMLRSKRGTLRIHQIIIPKQSHIVGKKISESGLKDEFGLLVLGLKEEGREVEFNPLATSTLKGGMALIVMGDMENIARETF